MSRKWRNLLIGVLAVAVLVILVILLNQGEEGYNSKYAGTDLSTDVSGIGRSNTYEAYVASYASEPEVKEEVAVDVLSFEGNAVPHDEGILTEDGSEVTWSVNMPQAGLYNIRLEYLTTESRGVDIERELLINGELPFSGAGTLITRETISARARRKSLKSRRFISGTTWVTRRNLMLSISTRVKTP